MIKEVLYYFEGLDDSILKLNEHLTDDYFEFKSFTLDKFLKKFRELISRPKNEEEDDDIFPLLGMSFADAIGLDNSKYFTQSQILNDKHIVFLRYAELEEDDFTKIKRGIEASKSGDFRIEINERVKRLVEKLKLIKAGHIKLISAFEFTDDKSCIPISYSHSSKNRNYNRYFFDNDDVIEFGLLEKVFAKRQSYLELALNSFFESYNIEDDKLRFVVLMICLESIFNKGKDETIRQTISKYAALTLTSDKQVFNGKVKRLKFLYDFRSSIVHGKEENRDDDKDYRRYKRNLEKISDYILELEEIVRKVLKELILKKEYSEMNGKNELFDYLNAKGFPE